MLEAVTLKVDPISRRYGVEIWHRWPLRYWYLCAALRHALDPKPTRPRGMAFGNHLAAWLRLSVMKEPLTQMPILGCGERVDVTERWVPWHWGGREAEQREGSGLVFYIWPAKRRYR